MSEHLNHLPAGKLRDSFHGCMLGGAVGDALGAPVEFMSRQDILERYGENGLQEMVPAYGRVGAITDDTQMALFTAEGMIRAFVRANTRGGCHTPSVVANAYLRWLHTQGINHPRHERCLTGWLLGHKELFSQRAPGNTCLSALIAMRSPEDMATNDSKGCGGVMRVAPIGMMLAGLSLRSPSSHDENFIQSFELGCQIAGITHGHPTGKLASGVFSAIVYLLLTGEGLVSATQKTLQVLEEQSEHEETSSAVRHALQLANDQPGTIDALEMLGEGWIAEEALAIGLYCALGASDFESGVALAVNHDGDSDSTGLITGHLLGALLGVSAIPARWLAPLELRSVLEEVAEDLATVGSWPLDDSSTGDDSEYYVKRYPGG